MTQHCPRANVIGMSQVHQRLLVAVALLLGITPAVTYAQAGKRRTATLYIHHGAKPRLQSRTVGRTLENFLKEREEVKFTSLDYVLESAKLARKQVAKADKLVKAAKTSVANLEVDQGVKQLENALKLYERFFHRLAKNKKSVHKYAGLLADLAMAHFLAGNEEGARQALLQAFGLHPKMEFDPKRFPPQMKRTFDESSFLADELGTGNAQVTTDPPVCEVWANGKFVGYAPQTVRGLTAGRNLMTLTRPGYATRTVPVNVEGGADMAQVTAELSSLRGAPAKMLTAALKEVRAGKAGKATAAAARRMGQDVLMLARMEGQDDIVMVTVWAYDRKAKKITAKAKATASSLDPDPEVGELVTILARALGQRARPRVPVRPAPPSESWFSSFRKSKYFWPVVGGVAAAVVVTGASVGIYYGAQGGEKDNRRRNLILLPHGTVGTF